MKRKESIQKFVLESWKNGLYIEVKIVAVSVVVIVAVVVYDIVTTFL